MPPVLAPAPSPMPTASKRNEATENAHLEEVLKFVNESNKGGRMEPSTSPAISQQLLAQVKTATSPTAIATRLEASSSRSPDDNIDPAIAGASMNASQSNDSGGEDMADGSGKRGNKRELSTSKRAAQNRAAQRAFRQRKEGYIKKLELEARDHAALEANYRAVQAENYQLRDYIINLQSRLIESQTEFPQPPSNIDLAQPRPDAGQATAAPTAPMGNSAMDQLQASAAQAAQAVADLGAGKHRLQETTFVVEQAFPPAKRTRSSAAEPDAGNTIPAAPKPEANGTGVSA